MKKVFLLFTVITVACLCTCWGYENYLLSSTDSPAENPGDKTAQPSFPDHRLILLASRYPDPPVTVSRILLQDITQEHPTILLDIAVDSSKIIMKKYPMLPYDFFAWSVEESPRTDMSSTLEEKYPGFLDEQDRIMKNGGYSVRLQAIRDDVRKMLDEKYPGLETAIHQDIDELIRKKYQDLPNRLAQIGKNPDTNPDLAMTKLICESSPDLIPEALEIVRDKHGKKLHQALIDILMLVETKHPGVLTALRHKMIAVTRRKYPGFERDMRNLHINRTAQLIKRLESKYPDFSGDLRNMLKEKYAGIDEELKKSIHKNFPELEGNLPPGRPGSGRKPGPPGSMHPPDGPPGFHPESGPGMPSEVAPPPLPGINPENAWLMQTLLVMRDLGNLARLFQQPL